MRVANGDVLHNCRLSLESLDKQKNRYLLGALWLTTQTYRNGGHKLPHGSPAKTKNARKKIGSNEKTTRNYGTGMPVCIAQSYQYSIYECYTLWWLWNLLAPDWAVILLVFVSCWNHLTLVLVLHLI